MTVAAGADSDVRTEVDSRVRVAWLALIWGLIIIPILITLLMPPRYGSATVDPAAYASRESAGAMQGAIINGLSFLILAIGVAAIILSTRYQHSLVSGIGVWLGVMALSFGPVVSTIYNSGLFLSPGSIQLPLLLTAVFLLPPVRTEWFVRQCKLAIELYTVLTLAALVVAPARVLQLGYDAGLVAAVDFRLHGIHTHANNFAPLLLVYLVLGWIAPARTARDYLMLFAVIAALLMAQSKTTMAALVVMYAIRFFYATGAKRFVAAYVSVAGAVAGLLALTLARPTWDRGLIDFFVADDDFTTLTGRTAVWEYGLALWRANPVLGYGDNFWSGQARLDFAAIHWWAPHHLHNQGIQTLVEAGLVGTAGLAILVGVLVFNAIRLRIATHGASLALVVFIIFRGFTEVPLEGPFFVTFLTLTTFLLVHRERDLPVRSAQSDSVETEEAAGTAGLPGLSLREQLLQEIQQERRMRLEGFGDRQS
jgi:O-antigen ligase